MKEGMRSSDTVRIIEDNNVDEGCKKFDLNVTEVDMGNNGLCWGEYIGVSSDMVPDPVNDEVREENSLDLGVENGKRILVDYDHKEKGVYLDSGEGDCAKDSLVELADRKSDSGEGVDGNVDAAAVTSKPKVRLGRPPKKKKKVTRTVKGKIVVDNHEGSLVDSDQIKNELDLVSNEIGYAKDSSVVQKEINVKGGEVADAAADTVVFASGLKLRSGILAGERKKETKTAWWKTDVSSDSDAMPKKKRGRPPKKIDAVSVKKIDADSIVNGPKEKRGRPPKKIDAVSVKKIDADSIANGPKEKRGRPPKEFGAVSVKKIDADSVTNGPKKKRGRPPKEIGAVSVKKIDADSITNGPKKKRGRPPKTIRVAKDNAGDPVKNEEALAQIEPEGDMSSSPSENEMKGKRIGFNDSGHMECEEATEVDVNGCSHKQTGKLRVERRGRKRKIVQTSVNNFENGAPEKKAKESPFDGEAKVVGRVLRSRATVMTGGRKHDSSRFTGDIVGDKLDKKNSDSGKKIIGKIKEETDRLTSRQQKFLEGRKGKIGVAKMIDIEKQKKIGFRKVSDQLKKVNKGSKFVDVADTQKVTSRSDKEVEGEGMRRSTQKQILKDRIKAMLKSAGWTIDLRPRNGKVDYFDAVYVHPNGRGFWSVTLAYKVLKQEIEDGSADSRAVSAFFPIEEDEWNSLLRKTTLGLKSKSKKSAGVKGKPSKGGSFKEVLKKKHAKEKGQLRKKQKGLKRLKIVKEKKGKKRFSLLARGSEKVSDFDGEGFLLYEGKRSLLSWMIDLGKVSLGGKVRCMNCRKSKALHEGKVTRDGIQCGCCNNTFSVSEFESHSGSALGQPWQNICLDSGTSLLQCLQDSWSNYKGSISLGLHSVEVNGDDPNDDTCNMCADGGNLICCDSCPAAFHQKCLDIQKFPTGDWSCIYCSCKFCQMVGETALEVDQNCDARMPTCRLCEEKYHPMCAQGNDTSLGEPHSLLFCCQKCLQISQELEELFGFKHQMEDGFSWSLIQHSDDNPDISSNSGAQKIESNAKLAVAWSIMDECFLPIVDQRSRINMIRNVTYSCGSNIRRLNYTGFVTAILERGDEIISAASLRIHGNLLAEMPFIGTRHVYRRQGMCRRLLTAIETALCSLNVEKLVLPAISELRQTWTSIFGFMPLEESDKKEMKRMSLILFPGVDMLQKSLVKAQIGVANLSSAIDLNSSGNTTDMDFPKSDSNISHDHEVILDNACGTADVAEINFQVSVVTGDKDRERENVTNPEAPAGNFPKFDRCDSDEINEEKNVPSGNSKLSEESVKDVKDKFLPSSETLSDTVNRELKTPHPLSADNEKTDVELTGEVGAGNHPRDQNIVDNRGTSTQALILV